MGSRDVARITEYLDLGQFRTGSTAVTPTAGDAELVLPHSIGAAPAPSN